MISYALSITEGMEDEPRTYSKAMKSKDNKLWLVVMQNELASLHKNHRRELVNKPNNQRIIGYKWIFKKKEGIPIFKKTGLVAKGLT